MPAMLSSSQNAMCHSFWLRCKVSSRGKRLSIWPWGLRCSCHRRLDETSWIGWWNAPWYPRHCQVLGRSKKIIQRHSFTMGGLWIHFVLHGRTVSFLFCEAVCFNVNLFQMIFQFAFPKSQSSDWMFVPRKARPSSLEADRWNFWL